MIKKWQFAFVFLLIFLFGCASPPAPDSKQAEVTRYTAQITAVSVPATFTPLSRAERLLTAEPQVTVTQNPLPTVATSTPIPFGETAVELRYTIPSIGLDRRLQGNISSQIIIADEASGELLKRENQAGVLIELQQALSNLELEPIPDGCMRCVYVSYNLPFDEQRSAGWLKEPAMLASIENYLALSLGPHFPPNTAVGLRRTASPYAPAHTIAITEDGMLYIWFATDNELDIAVPADPAILEALAQLEMTQLAPQYQVTCAGTPTEVLFVRNGERSKWVSLSCPEYALPTTLLPLYTALDDIIAAKMESSGIAQERPLALFPLDALLDYKRVDGAQLTIFADDTAVAISPSNQTVTTTLLSSDVLSLTTTLLASNRLKLGLTTFLGDGSVVGEDVTPTTIPPRSVLLLRGTNGVYDAVWNGTADIDLLEPLNTLLAQLLADVLVDDPEVEVGIETATPEITSTPTATETATPEP